MPENSWIFLCALAVMLFLSIRQRRIKTVEEKRKPAATGVVIPFRTTADHEMEQKRGSRILNELCSAITGKGLQIMNPDPAKRPFKLIVSNQRDQSELFRVLLSCENKRQELRLSWKGDPDVLFLDAAIEAGLGRICSRIRKLPDAAGYIPNYHRL